MIDRKSNEDLPRGRFELWSGKLLPTSKHCCCALVLAAAYFSHSELELVPQHQWSGLFYHLNFDSCLMKYVSCVVGTPDYFGTSSERWPSIEYAWNSGRGQVDLQLLHLAHCKHLRAGKVCYKCRRWRISFLGGNARFYLQIISDPQHDYLDIVDTIDLQTGQDECKRSRRYSTWHMS